MTFKPNKIFIAGLIFVGLGTSLSFQNCSGSGFKSSWSDQNSSNSSETGNDEGEDADSEEPAPGAGFQKNDPFNYASLPKALQQQMVQVQLDVLKYGTYNTGAKAIAINRYGLGFVSLKSSGNVDEAKLTALEACFAIGGAQPCGLLAVGDVFEVGLSQLTNSFTYNLTAETTLNANIPFLTLATRTTVFTAYNNATSPKALAISLEGTSNWVAHTENNPVLNVQEAQRLALERCEMSSILSPCTLYASNNNVVFQPAMINRAPIINYQQAQVSLGIPGMRTAAFNSLIRDTYIPNITPTNFGAIYITAGGAGGYDYNSTSSQSANTRALSNCNSNANGKTCFKFAEKLVVENFLPNIKGLTYNRLTHCLVVPRTNCAAHNAMGCFEAQAYVINSMGIPEVTNCL
jgi:hypothetical protein